MTVARTIGLALGAGGALGYGHIPVLEAMDELGVRPTVIAGASMGAIIGASYAAGHKARTIHDFYAGLRKDRWLLLRRLWQSRPRPISGLFGPHRATAGHLDAEEVLGAFGDIIPADFAALGIPLKVVATDFYGWREVVFTSGELHPAVAASMAIPGAFRAVVVEGRALVDGGVVNPLPFEHAQADIVIAVDVVGGPLPGKRPVPRRIESIFGSSQLLMRAITQEKLKGVHRPHILVEPDVSRFRFYELGRAAEIVAAAMPVKDEVKRRLEALLA